MVNGEPLSVFLKTMFPANPNGVTGSVLAYSLFQLHYARIAEETRCEMFIAGCEMVMTEHREAEWRKVIESIRSVYNGPVSYNTDKYQEDHVKWWDCVDVISSSGYYPENDWENQLDRIERVVNKFQKPFFFRNRLHVGPKDLLLFLITGK